MAKISKEAKATKTTDIVSKERFKGGHTTEISEVILRFWDGLEVEDADFDLVVNLVDIDYEHATARDMFGCAFIQAVRRLYGSKHAVFARTIAYVDLIMDGKPRKVYRFDLSLQAKRIIQSFDKAKTLEERAKLVSQAGTNFVLRAPSKSKTFGYKSKKQKEFIDRRRRRRLLIKGKATCKGSSKPRAEREAKERKDDKQLKKQAKVDRNFLQLSDVRNATGLIKFQVGKIRPSVAD